MIQVLLIKWLLTIVLLYVIRLIFFRQSFRVTGLAPIIMVAVVIAPVNVFIKEIAEFTALPQSIGMLFALCVLLNALIIYIASFFVPYFYVENFAVALTVSVFLAGFTILLYFVSKELNLSAGLLLLR